MNNNKSRYAGEANERESQSPSGPSSMRSSFCRRCRRCRLGRARPSTRPPFFAGRSLRDDCCPAPGCVRSMSRNRSRSRGTPCVRRFACWGTRAWSTMSPIAVSTSAGWDLDDIIAMYRTRRLVEPLGLRGDRRCRGPALRCGQRSTAPPLPPSRTTGTSRHGGRRVPPGDSWTAATVCTSRRCSSSCSPSCGWPSCCCPTPSYSTGRTWPETAASFDLVEAGDEAAAFAELDDYLTCSETDVPEDGRRNATLLLA